MSKIDNWFNNQKKEQPYWSDIVIFNTCITGKKVYKTDLGKAFNRLVNKEDWKGNLKDDILGHCYTLIAKK